MEGFFKSEDAQALNNIRKFTKTKLIMGSLFLLIPFGFLILSAINFPKPILNNPSAIEMPVKESIEETKGIVPKTTVEEKLVKLRYESLNRTLLLLRASVIFFYFCGLFFSFGVLGIAFISSFISQYFIFKILKKYMEYE